MNILIIDSTARFRIIFNAFKKYFLLNEKQGEVSFYRYYRESFQIYDWISGEWKEQIQRPDNIHLRIRHGSDFLANIPIGGKQVYFGGYADGVRSQDTPEYGFEHGIPVSIPSDPDSAVSIFTDDWAKQLVEWVRGGLFPQLLVKRTFNPALEEALCKKSASFDPQAFVYKPQKDGTPLIVPAPFYTNFFQVLMSEEPIKTLIVWPERINHQKLLLKLDDRLSYSYDKFNDKFICTIISSNDDFQNLADLSGYDLAILPAELRWEYQDHHTELQGIAIAGQLRRKKFGGITILASMAPAFIAYHLLKKTDTNLEVLNMGYTYIWNFSGNDDIGFPHMSEKLDEIKKAWDNLVAYQKSEIHSLVENKFGHRMSPGRLADIRYSLLPTGKLSAVIHEFRRVTQNCVSVDVITQAAKSALADLEYVVDPLKLTELKALSKDIISDLKKKEDLEEARLVLSISRQKIASLLPPSKHDELSLELPPANNREWGVLLLEDDLDAAIQIIDLLNGSQIPVWHERNAIDALKRLEEDYAGNLIYNETNNQCPPNFIRVVLADMRLQNLSTESSRWDVLQGYEFVDKVNSSIPNFVTTVILTQQEQRMLRRSSAANPTWFPKSILRGDGNQELFLEKVIELGELPLPSIPDSELWKSGYLNIHQYPFSVYYRQYRMSSEYHIDEQWVNTLSRFFLNLWLCCEDENSQQAELLRKEIGNLLQSRGDKLTNGLTQNLRQDRMIPLFRTKLAARRAALTIADYLNENDFEKIDIENRRKELEILYHRIFRIDREINKWESGIKEAESNVKDLITRVSDTNEAEKEIKIKDLEKRIEEKRGRIKEFQSEKKAAESRYKEIKSEEEMLPNYRVFKILFLIRNHRLPEISEIDPINIDRTLLNKHLGLNGEIRNWCSTQNLLLEERDWLQQMRQLGWEF